jgi:ribonuclease III
VTPEREAALRAFEERLGHRFRDLALLDRALTHTSYVNEGPDHSARHNEALEFLGDAVIGLVVADILHQEDPEGREGRKTLMRGRAIAARGQAERAEALGLPALLSLGKGAEKMRIRANRKVWADAYEAVIAALYVDGGLAAAARFLRRDFHGRLTLPSPTEPGGDAKTALQELLQKRGAEVPDYVVVSDEGVDSATRFRIECRIAGKVAGEGAGHSKKEAQQDAARRALEAVQSGS